MWKNAKKRILNGKPFFQNLLTDNQKQNEKEKEKDNSGSFKNTPEKITIIKSDSVNELKGSISEERFVDEDSRLLEESKQIQNNLPMIILNEENMYNVEGFAQLDEKNIRFYENKQLHYDMIEDYEITETNREYNYYMKHFFDREHFNFVGKFQDFKTKTLDDFVISFKLDITVYRYMYILRTKYGNKFQEIDDNELTVLEAINKIFDLDVKEIMPIIHPLASNKIVRYDKKLIKTTFTFGIIYQKFGQLTEKEIFSNYSHSPEFEEFLQFIGTKVNLKNFKGFRGGLDTSNESCEHSIYEQHEDSEIMFHVSTMLPHSKTDTQHLEKKRHIGNDKVAIIFQDIDTPFSPSTIKSKLLHVFLIIQPVKVDGITKRYKLTIVSRKDVPYFGPFIRRPFVFKKNNNLKSFILAKLINAEYSSLQAPGFSQYSIVALTQSLENLTNDLRKSSLNFNDCFKFDQETHNFSSALKRTSVYKVISSIPIDTIKDPLNRALSRSGYLIRDKKNEEDSNQLEPSSPSSEEKFIKLRNNRSVSKNLNVEDKYSSRDDITVNKNNTVYPKLRSTFTYRDERYKKESYYSSLNDIKSREFDKSSEDDLPTITENNIEIDLKENNKHRFTITKNISVKEITPEINLDNQQANNIGLTLSKNTTSDHINDVSIIELKVQNEIDESKDVDTEFVEYLKRTNHSMKKFRRRSGKKK